MAKITEEGRNEIKRERKGKRHGINFKSAEEAAGRQGETGRTSLFLLALSIRSMKKNADVTHKGYSMKCGKLLYSQRMGGSIPQRLSMYVKEGFVFCCCLTANAMS